MSLMQWFKNLFTPRPTTLKSNAPGKGTIPGRNEPCWCGSGKKYKQCHIRQDTAERVEAQYAAMAAAKGKGGNGVTRTGAKAKAKAEEFKEWKGGAKGK